MRGRKLFCYVSTLCCTSLSNNVWPRSMLTTPKKTFAMSLQAAPITTHHDSSPAIAHGEETSSPAATSEELKKEVETSMRLRAELASLSERLDNAHEFIRDLIGLVDKEKYAEKIAELEKSHIGGGNLFFTNNADELERALQRPDSRILLLKDYHYVLGTHGAITISRTNVSIIGNNATIEGCIKLEKNAVLDGCDVTFHGLKNTSDAYDENGEDWNSRISLPCIEATQGSRVYLRNCSIFGGRDGLFLGMDSEAELRHVLIADCARGIYEGIRCNISLSQCTMAGNFFHLVLLGKDRKAKADALSASNNAESKTKEGDMTVRFLDTSHVGKKRTRADISLDHNPITDTYEHFIYNGKEIELPEKLTTCGLSDPVY